LIEVEFNILLSRPPRRQHAIAVRLALGAASGNLTAPARLFISPSLMKVQMRALRTTIVLLIAITGFTGCKKGGGYLQPVPVPSSGFTR
jgi:hypothetical protein